MYTLSQYMKRVAVVVLATSLSLIGLRAIADDRPKDDGPKDARSVHLWWRPGANVSAFYNEVKIDHATNGTYVSVCAFTGGYMGLQQRKDGTKDCIFSVWDAPADSNLAPSDRQVEVLYCDPSVKTKRFGGEGTGQQSYYEFPWQEGTTYKLLVRARTVGTKTAYVAFIFDPRINRWKHLATFATTPKRSLLNGLYSFVEDYRRDHASAREERVAEFSNGWVLISDEWQPLKSAGFSAVNRPEQTNIDASVDGASFRLATGGSIENLHAHIKDVLTTTAHDPTPPPLEHVFAGPQTEAQP